MLQQYTVERELLALALVVETHLPDAGFIAKFLRVEGSRGWLAGDELCRSIYHCQEPLDHIVRQDQAKLLPQLVLTHRVGVRYRMVGTDSAHSLGDGSEHG